MVEGPFCGLSEPTQRRLFAGLSLAFGLTTGWLFYMGRWLESPEAPQGIVSFELARTLQRSGSILGGWSGHARDVALLVQGFDYLYLVIYPLWFSMAVDRLRMSLDGRWRSIGVVLAWAVLASGLFDAVENYGLIRQLLHGPSAREAALAWTCAVVKFALIASAAAFLVLAGAEWGRRRALRAG